MNIPIHMLQARKLWQDMHIPRQARKPEWVRPVPPDNAVSYTILFGEALLKGQKKAPTTHLNLFKPRKYPTVQYIKHRVVTRHSDDGFDDMPYWLKHMMRAFNITFKRRKPTSQEMLDTISDAREHRKLNNELDITDFEDHYKFGKHNIFSPLS